MKKLLLTLIVSFAFCGSIFAQEPTNYYTPNTSYETWDLLLTYAQINGVFITADDNWADMELATFVGDECRGAMFLLDETDLGDEYPACQLPVNYTDVGETVTYRMYDHGTGTEYVGTINIEYVTGNGDHTEIWDGDDPVIINYTPLNPGQTFTKDILGYGTSGTDRYYLIASPIGTVNPADVANLVEANGHYDLYAFSENATGNEWQTYKPANFDLEPGKGYLYANIGDVTLEFTGTPYTGSGEVTLGKSDAPFAGWNLVGNPFADTAYITKDFYVLNETGSRFLPVTLDRAIAPMEGVLVMADNDGETLTFSTEAPANDKASLALNLSSGRAVVDRAIVNFGEGNTLPKFQFRQNSTMLCIPVDGEDFAIANAEEMGEMPVSFKAGNNGSYMISVNAENVSFNYLHLIDNLTGADVDLLANPSYSFDALTTDYASRFRLVFATGNANEDSFAFFSNGNLVISNEGDATVQVIDVNGRILSSKTINGSASVNVSGAAGVYMVRLINGDNARVQKVVVK